jgi:hypothetical protein
MDNQSMSIIGVWITLFSIILNKFRCSLNSVVFRLENH